MLAIGITLNVILRLFEKSARWLQSSTAIYGSWFIFSLIVLILTLVGLDGTADIQDGHPLLPVFLALAIWNFLVIARILKETLEISTGFSIVIAFVTEVVFALATLMLVRGNLI